MHLQRDAQGRLVAGTVSSALPQLPGWFLMDAMGDSHGLQAFCYVDQVQAEVPEGLVGWRMEKVRPASCLPPRRPPMH